MSEDIRIERAEESLDLDDWKDHPVSRLTIAGSMRVPADDYPITAQVTLVLSDAAAAAAGGGVKCDIPELADERGWFQVVRTVAAPTQDWDAEGFEVAVVPDFALLAARSGRVELTATVRIMEGQDPHRLMGEGRCSYRIDQPEPGYLEWSADQIDGDRHVATLAVATAAVDGTVHRSEVNVIRRYFRTRYEGRPDADDLRAQVSLTLQEALRRLDSGQASPARLIEDASSALLHEHSVPVRRSAYMLAVRVAAADRVLAGQERGLLEVVSSSLGLPVSESDAARDRIRAEAQFVATHLGRTAHPRSSDHGTNSSR
jgi:tellurite resistance protein